MTDQEEKRRLRAALREMRAGLPDGYQEAASRAIARRVLKSESYRRARVLFVYAGVKGEPEIIARAVRDGKIVCAPRCKKRPLMDAAVIRGLSDLIPGAFGIPAPREDAPAIDPQEIDLALIPCLAAGRDGKRLGHGAGYYDAYLKNLRCEKICLCFERMIVPGIPMDERDVWMDRTVTEEDGGCSI